MGPSEASQYVHQPLSDPSETIRLLKLLRDPLDSLIRGELYEVEFPSTQTYSALSYVWGPPDTGSTVLINDRHFKIRKNLHAFLSQLRSRLIEGQSLIVWADAICIDQTSTSEKNFQVRMMGQIYSNAGGVLAWLGDDKQVQRMFDSLEDYRNDLTRLGTDDTRYPSGSSQEEAAHRLAFVEYPAFGPDLLTFYNLEYFRRAWIMQELILAPSLSMICGRSCLTHDGLVTLFNHLRFTRVMTGRTKVDQILADYLDSKIEMSFVSDESFTLKALIQDYGYTECSDPHDKIYAFIGTAKDLRSNYVVGYDTPLQFLMIETILEDVRGSGLTNYFGIAYLLHTSELYTSVLYSLNGFIHNAAWASAFRKRCQETLPRSTMCSRMPVEAELAGKAGIVDGSSVAIENHKRHKRTPWNGVPPTCLIINGVEAQTGDLIFRLRSLCFVYRWYDPDLRLVAIGITPDLDYRPPTGSTIQVWQHTKSVYTKYSAFDVDKSIDLSTRPDLLAMINDWQSCCSSNVTKTLDLSIPVSNFLVMLEADFPNFINQGGVSRWT